MSNYLVDGGVASVGDDTLDLLQLVVLVPHSATVSHNIGHTGVDDDIAGHVQVGNTLNNKKSSIFVAKKIIFKNLDEKKSKMGIFKIMTQTQFI